MYKTSGDTNLLVQFHHQVDIETSRRVQTLVQWLGEARIPGIVEWSFGYSTVLIEYNPVIVTEPELRARLTSAFEQFSTNRVERLEGNSETSSRCVMIPVCYGTHGKEFGPDLGQVAHHNEISQEEVVRLHSQPDYYIYFTGFLPSFPFLGGMSPAIATPRLRRPRTRVPAGSVGIAGEQTGIYPVESPGGWQLIGRTPVSLFDLRREHPFLLQAGDWLRFQPIDAETYAHIALENERTPAKVATCQRFL
ncbi:5-oxoprolinase subunit PxpB [Alicyclobacillus sp. SO9]|nr:5-oxoprolinase subunit PxpB [Alicyclobacillus sp. SO9]